MSFDWDFLIKSLPQIAARIPITLLLSVLALFLGLILGFLLALCRINQVPILNQFASLFISFNRGTPLLINLYLVFFSFPIMLQNFSKQMGWSLNVNDVNPYLLAIIAYSFNCSGYLAEIIRSALCSVDKGQTEAAQSVGLTYFQALKRIVIPQALVVATPNIGNLFVSLIKGTSLAYAVTIEEILGHAKTLATSGYTYLEAYINVTIIYWILCFIFQKIFHGAEKYLKRFRAEITV